MLESARETIVRSPDTATATKLQEIVFSSKQEHFTVSIRELCRVDPKIYFFSVFFIRYTTKDDKHLKTIS